MPSPSVVHSHPSPATLAQCEALANEYKGQLFEFLVGQELADYFACKDAFHQGLTPARRHLLARHQTWLRQNRPHLVRQLPHLAKECAHHLIPVIPAPVQQVVTVGQWSAAVDRSPLKEADLFLVRGETLIPVSLKLCKRESFVNTKSAGILSFLNKYFATCGARESAARQANLNHTVQASFEHMGRELYRSAGLPFNGGFDAAWTAAGHSELPGQLTRPLQNIVSAHYQRVAQALHTALKALSIQREPFAQGLAPLLGMGRTGLIQAICFHAGTDTYQLDHIEVKHSEDFPQLCTGLKVMDYIPPLASFEIHLPRQILQIRVKPMGKFTVAGLKVNCSVKKAIS